MIGLKSITLVFLVTLISRLFFLVIVFLSVAFIILLERRVLRYVQERKGPNKVGYIGVIQSFGDAIKLFIREQGYPLFSNIRLFYLAPILSLLLILLVWLVVPLGSGGLRFRLSLIFMFCCLRIGVYVLITRGWSSNSNYALLGAIRGVAQTISYEVGLIILLLSVILLVRGYGLRIIVVNQNYLWFVVLFSPIFLCWTVTMVAETNRTPFDFAEGESELVSGFNIEYGRGGFALLFLAEYGIIIFISYLVSYLYFGGLGDILLLNIKGLFFCFFFLWVRGTYPRFRYDKLIGLVWRDILPVSLNLLFIYTLARII